MNFDIVVHENKVTEKLSDNTVWLRMYGYSSNEAVGGNKNLPISWDFKSKGEVDFYIDRLIGNLEECRKKAHKKLFF